MMAEPTANYVLARRTGKIPLHVLDDPVTEPVGERSRPRNTGKLSNESVSHSDSLSQMPHKRLKELPPRCAGRAVQNDAKRGDFIVGQRYVRFGFAELLLVVHRNPFSR
jgi:hypothetical protein